MDRNKVLSIVTMLFLVLAIATVAIYFLLPGRLDYFYYCGGAAVVLYFVRLILKNFA